MSTTVDKRVVEMQFNNKQFESGVSTTMSTLDKLKQKLNFGGASKGLEEVSASAKKVDMSGLSNGVDTVRTRFSALDVVAVTALANITNSAVNAGKRMVSALTIDPIKTGFQEYETQINATQTILANTASKGSTIKDVNKALEELNKYADLTIYNFTEMTRNIGTFTAAGIDLDTSVNAIQGIANLAAVSGSTSQQASTAMYQLSQALAAGTVKLMDWNSVVNAGMGGEMFQNALKETSELLGTGAEAAIKAEGSFRESLKNGWLTAEVLTETLKKFTTTGANERVAEYTGLSKEAVEAALESAKAQYGEAEAIEYASKALAEKSGKNADEIASVLQFAKNAEDAATKVKTFSQLWDVMKESAQSGWAQTWKILVGDFEQARDLLTPLADVITGFLNKMSDARNTLLQSALGKGFANMFDGLNKVLNTTQNGIEGVLEPVKATSEALEDLGVIVDKVILGDFGNGQERFDALTKAGYNYYRVQNKVNETLGNSYRHSEEAIAAQDKLLGTQSEITAKSEEQAEATTTLTDAQKDQLKTLVAMDDAQLKSAGYTKEQIKALRELESQAKKLGIPVDEFIDKLDQINGRWLLINSFKNIGQSLIDVFSAIGKAWRDVFSPITADQVFNVIAGFHKLTTYLKFNKDAAEDLRSTFKGVFAALDIVLTLVSGPIKIAFKLFAQVLGMFDMNILQFTGAIGESIYKFKEFIDVSLDFTKVFEGIVDPIKDGVKAFKEWIETLKDSENLPEDIAKGIANGIGKAIDFIKEKFELLKESFQNGFSGLTFGNANIGEFLDKLTYGLSIAGQVIGELGKILLEKINGVLSKHGFQEISLDMIQGLVNGIKDGAYKAWNAMIELGKQLIAKIKEVLGIHSPSTVFFAIGGFIIAGLVGGLLAGTGPLKETMQTIGSKIGEFFGDIDFQSIFSMVISAGLLKALLDVASAAKSGAGVFDGIADILDGVGDTMKNVSKVVKKFKGVLGSFSMSIKAKALKDIATAILILVGAIAVLSFIEPKKIWNAVGAIAAIAAVMGVLFAVMNRAAGASKIENPKDFIQSMGTMVKMGSMLMALSSSILLIALAMKVLESIDPETAKYAFAGLAGIVVAIAGVIAAYGLCIKGHAAKNIAKLGPTLLLLSASLLMMTSVIKQLGGLDRDALIQGGNALLQFTVIIGLMITMSRLAGNKIGKIGSAILNMATALTLMAFVVKILGSMERDVLIQGGTVIVAFTGILTGMVAMTKLAGDKNLTKLGRTLLAMSGAMVIMAIVVRLLGGMDVPTLIKGTVAVTAFGGILVGLVAATNLVGEKDLKRVGTTLLMMSIAIGMLAAVSLVLGMFNIKHLATGITAITLLGAVMTGMIWATRGANDCKGSIMAMAIAIGIMAVAVAALSFIDVGKLAGAVAAMGTLMLIFTLLINIAGKAKGSLGVLVTMTVAMTLMGTLLLILSRLPAESTIGSAIALSTLLLTMTGVLVILSKIAVDAGNALIGVIALTAMAIPLLSFVGVLALMQNVSNATENASALAKLAAALTILLLPLSAVGFLVAASGGTILLGIVALLAMAVPMAAFVGVLALMQNIQNASANAELLTDLMTKLTAMLVIAAVVGPLALVGVGAMAAMAGLIVAIGALAVGVGALMEKFPELESFLNKGIPILEKIAYAIGAFAGNLVSGFVNTVAGTLPVLGASLSGFMINAMPFIAGIKMVDASMLEGVGVLTASILALTAASFINGITSLLTLGIGSLPQLGMQLSGFIDGALPFINSASLIKEDSVAGVKSLADMILTLTKANVIEGLTSWFTGGSSLANFGAQLVPFGEAMMAFSQTVIGIDESAVVAAANAGKIMAEMANTIPNSGGVLGFFAGENDLSGFTSQLVPFGEAIAAFSQSVAGKINEDAVLAAANAGKTMVELAKTLPNSGGVVGWFMGENDMATFGMQLVSFGNSITQFSRTVTGNISEDAVLAAANAGATMVKLAETLPNTGGVLAFFTGDNDLVTFGSQLVSFGKSIVAFSKEVVGIDEKAVAAAANAGSVMSTLAKSLPESGGFASIFTADNDMSTFGREMVKFGESIKDFSDEVADIDSSAVSNAVTQYRKIMNLAKSITGVDFGKLSGFGKALENVGKTGIDNFIKVFETAGSDVISAVNNMIEKAAKGIDDNRDEFESAAEKLVDEAIDGIRSKRSDFKDACDELADKGPSGIKAFGNYTEFRNAGKYLGDGLIAGINSKKQAVYNAAYALGQKAVQGEKDGQQSNSPSKATIKAGHWLGEGLIIGMKAMGQKVYKSGSDLGHAATSNISTAIRNLSETISTDIDAQPTIRPVMDLSDVKTGAAAIDGMFNKTARVNTIANVGTINTMMNSRIQNGTNDDVISAINKLGKELSNVGNTSYNINGITYDDGSTTSAAVRSLVRAIGMERRV